MAALRVTVEHLHSIELPGGRYGWCARRSREWAAAHGLSWADFVRDGIDAEALLATGDALARMLVDHARKVQTEGAPDHG